MIRFLLTALSGGLKCKLDDMDGQNETCDVDFRRDFFHS